MNDLFDRILDMPVRQRVTLLVGTVFVLFGGPPGFSSQARQKYHAATEP